MSTTGQDADELTGMAAAAVWRRRQEAYSEVVGVADDEEQANGYSLPDTAPDNALGAGSAGDASRVNGFHANGHVALNSSPESTERNFADLQNAGLTAIISLATAPSESPVLQPGAPPSPNGLAPEPGPAFGLFLFLCSRTK